MLFLRRICKILWEWSTRYPLLFLETAILILILYGISGRQLGLTYLFWNKSGLIQLVAGIATGLLFAEITFVGFLLDADEDWFGNLFGEKAQDAGLASLWPMYGTVLTFFWILLVPAAFTVNTTPRFYFHPGLLVGFAIFAALILFSTRFTKRLIPIARFLFEKLQKGTPSESELPLHVQALAFFLGFLIIYFGLVVFAPYLQTFPPAAAVCTLMAAITALYGAIHFHLPRRRLVVFILIASFWILLANIQPFRHPIPELNYESRSIQEVKKYPIVKRNESGLLSNKTVLNQWKALHQRGGSKYPPLVLICAGGGGIRAALWSGVVLKTLEEEKELQNFPYYIRLMTGASGGMLGASYYASTLNPPGSSQTHSVPLNKMIENLSKDSLSPVARTLVLRDIVPFLGFARYDRGIALQQAWGRNMENALDIPFRKLAEGEQAGWRPSLILSPMIVEDGRLLLISNLDLADLTANRVNELGDVTDMASRQAFEFYRMFRDPKLLLSTAVRLNASFPYVTPSAQLPTVPSLRLADAGYFDNYGVNLATEWLYSNLKGKESIHDQVSGILVIQIRHQLDNVEPAEELSWWRRGLSGLTTPIEGALRARESILSFRNDEDLEHLNLALNREAEGTGPNFFSTVIFELKKDISLSWILTDTEKAGITTGMKDKNNMEALKSLVEWWKVYGPSNNPPEREGTSPSPVLQQAVE